MPMPGYLGVPTYPASEVILQVCCFKPRLTIGCSCAMDPLTCKSSFFILEPQFYVLPIVLELVAVLSYRHQHVPEITLYALTCALKFCTGVGQWLFLCF